jgi:hypothetical protein
MPSKGYGKRVTARGDPSKCYTSLIRGQVKTPMSVWLAVRGVFDRPLGQDHKITAQQWAEVARKHEEVTRSHIPTGKEDDVCPVCAVSLAGNKISTLQHLQDHGFNELDATCLSGGVSIFYK